MRITHFRLEEHLIKVSKMEIRLQETYNNRSDDWKASQKGANYKERIKQLSLASTGIRDAIDALEEYLDN